jgi:hypothetical protein
MPPLRPRRPWTCWPGVHPSCRCPLWAAAHPSARTPCCEPVSPHIPGRRSGPPGQDGSRCLSVTSSALNQFAGLLSEGQHNSSHRPCQVHGLIVGCWLAPSAAAVHFASAAHVGKGSAHEKPRAARRGLQAPGSVHFQCDAIGKRLQAATPQPTPPGPRHDRPGLQPHARISASTGAGGRNGGSGERAGEARQRRREGGQRPLVVTPHMGCGHRPVRAHLPCPPARPPPVRRPPARPFARPPARRLPCCAHPWLTRPHPICPHWHPAARPWLHHGWQVNAALHPWSRAIHQSPRGRHGTAAEASREAPH